MSLTHCKVMLLAAVLLLSGCAGVEIQEENVFPSVSGGKALVYFFRESRFVGGGISYHIHVGEEKIGALASGTYFFKEFDPGEYTFWAETEAKDQVTITLEANTTYYVKGGVTMGFFAGHPDLTVVHEIEGKAELPNLKYATLPAE